jgi:hypothetical protein
MRQKVLWLTEPTLKTTLLCIKGGSRKKAVETILSFGVKEMEDPHYDGRGFVRRILPDEHKKGFTFWILWYDGQSVISLAHEAVHLAMGTLDDRGIPTRIENEEIIAYHVGFWVNVIGSEIKVVELEDDMEDHYPLPRRKK